MARLFSNAPDCSFYIVFKAFTRLRISEPAMKHNLYGLTELRGIAALCVVPGHLELLKVYYGMEQQFWFPIPGKLAVCLFFVLSGFLITLLAHREQQTSGLINIKRFYLKRVLRIWPLYFLIFGLSLFFLNSIEFTAIPIISESALSNITWLDYTLILLILPNLLILVIPFASQAWSIGIEEQFYLAYPVALSFFRNIIWLSGFLIFIVFLPEVIELTVGSPIIPEEIRPTDLILMIAFDSIKWFSCIAIGCLAAMASVEARHFVQRYVFSLWTQVFILCLFIYFVYLIGKASNEAVVSFRIHAVVFAVFIVNIALNKKTIFRISNGVLRYIGTISYGLYMYHTLGIIIAFRVVLFLFGDGFTANSFLENLVLYIASFGISILLSAISYRFFEEPILNLKKTLIKPSIISSD